MSLIYVLKAYRIANQFWNLGRKVVASAIQSRCSEVFGIDIHPAAIIGKVKIKNDNEAIIIQLKSPPNYWKQGIMLDHGTGIVIGETARIGDNCTLLHGVILGSSGKSPTSDRHPKLGDGVFVGAGATILGNIRIGSGAKIGSGAVVLKDVPPNTTAVGSPAKIIGVPKRDGGLNGDSGREHTEHSKHNSSALLQSTPADIKCRL